LRIVSIADPSMPVELGSLQTASCAYGLDVWESVAYVADQYDGLRLVDVSDPGFPFEAGYFDTGGYVDGVTVRDSLIFAADHWNGLHIMKSLYTGIRAQRTPKPGGGTRPAVVASGRMFLSQGPGVLLDACGRGVKRLVSGQNDVRDLAPGVYFLRHPEETDMRRLLLVR
jgi:hypothetical protein